MKRANKFKPAKQAEIEPEVKQEVKPVEAAPAAKPVRHERYFHPERKVD